MRSKAITILFLAVLLLLAAGCGSRQETARRKLSEKGVAMSDEAFIKSVRDGP